MLGLIPENIYIFEAAARALGATIKLSSIIIESFFIINYPMNLLQDTTMVCLNYLKAHQKEKQL